MGEKNHELCCVVFFQILPNLHRDDLHPLDYFTSTCIRSKLRFTNIRILQFYIRSKLRFTKETKIRKYCAISEFLGVGKNFRLLMQSCCFFCFFFSRPFHENFKFLKNCPYDFHEILHSHSTPKGAPACAMASKSYGWDVRNIAKISPKMVKKGPFFDFRRKMT